MVVIFVIAIGWWKFLGARINNLPMTASISGAGEDKRPVPLLSVVVKNLQIPWALDFLPDGTMLFTERPGKIYSVDLKKSNEPVEIASIEEAAPIGEGGLLGLAVHPDFQHNPFVYVYYTYQLHDNYLNRVVRYQLSENKLHDPSLIIDKIPGAPTHNGGRIRFGPDNYLYITTGDAQIPDAAQDINSFAGKILRIKDDGSIPEDNPFINSPVYSYGHRNPQGIAWDEQGQLWATEHGPTAHDEINLIKPGRNYGWPIITGKGSQSGMETPAIESGYVTWAPAGAEILDNVLYFCGLRGRALYGFDLKTKKLSKYLSGSLGRLREIKLAPGGLFYVATNNRDGRGIPKKDDDMIVIINPEKLR